MNNLHFKDKDQHKASLKEQTNRRLMINSSEIKIEPLLKYLFFKEFCQQKSPICLGKITLIKTIILHDYVKGSIRALAPAPNILYE